MSFFFRVDFNDRYERLCVVQNKSIEMAFIYVGYGFIKC